MRQPDRAQSAALGDAQRALSVCNACRYCEGFCAVFPALELRREFSAGDLGYLANLCHNCRACYYACQYAPPHEFGVNLPRTFAALRWETYQQCAWPRLPGRLFSRNARAVSLAAALCLSLVLALTTLLQPPQVLRGVHLEPGAFYAVIPWGAMVGVATATLGFSLLAFVVGGVRFWRTTGGGSPWRLNPSGLRAWLRASSDVLTLRYLGGGAGGRSGCNDRTERFSHSRRMMHHALFYGFWLCFASTCVAAFYEDVLGQVSPYPLFSLPVLLGTAGGIGMVIGACGLLWLRLAGDAAPAEPSLAGADYALVLLLLLTAATGLLLLLLRETGAMGLLLAVHLGFVLTLFLVMPYSKFIHGLYRALALLRAALERGPE